MLVIALLVGLCTSLAAAGTREPDNPISSEAEHLDPESLQGSGNLLGDGEGDGQSDETEPPTEETEPPTEETEPPTEETEPPTEETEPPTEETEPPTEETQPPTPQPTEPSPTEPSQGDDGEEDPTTPPTTPNDDEGDNTGGTTPGDDEGGPDDSGEPGDGVGGDDGDGGGDGGDTGTGDDEKDNSPKIYTDLETKTITKKELPDGVLNFVAYPVGEGENLSVKVRLKNNTHSGNGIVLTSADGQSYQAQLDFNAENTFILTLWEGSELLGTVQYRIGYYADKASAEEPEVGDYPPSIVTNLDGESLDMTSQSFPLTVIARTHSELGARPIYSNHIEVRLDGKVVEKSYGDSQPTYQLYFEAPQIGDEADHIVTILAWDGQGNSTMKIYTVTYHQISEGDDAGYVTVVMDATTVGLGILDSGTLSIVEGETAASVVLRFLEEYGYEADYQGNTTTNFYLRRIIRGDIAYRASVPEELWKMIQRDGITTNSNYDRDSLGEFDFTQGSGWMYAINGTLYQGTGMSGYKVRNGITIYLRFTLSYGKDIGGYDATGGGYGKLSSYCGIWINGGYQALGHDFQETDRQEPTATEDGYIEYTCSKCQETKREVLPATGGEPEPEPTDPEPTEPEPTEPEPTDPEPTDPEPTEPEPTDPEPTDPEPTDPEPTEPEPTDPEPTDPEPTQPPENETDILRNGSKKSDPDDRKEGAP